MKATFTVLAALMVSICTGSTAVAQSPGAQYAGPVMPAGAVVGAPAAGAYAGAAAEGCATGNCGKSGLLGRLGLRKSDGCDGGAGCCGKGGSNIGGAIKNWLCRPYPSDAPIIRRAQYPLGFPHHPYVRSPRDYFMMD